MKKIFVLTIVTLIGLTPLVSFSQDGSKALQKAEVKFKNQEYSTALKLISKAEKKNYKSVCENTWEDTNAALNILRAKIYVEQGDYELARQRLNMINLETPQINLDSIRIRTYQLEIGPDSLRNMIDASLLNLMVEGGISDCYALIPLTNKVTIMRFKIDWKKYLRSMVELSDKEKAELWREEFLKSNNYLMIKKKD